MPKVYSLEKKREVTLKTGDLVSLKITHSRKCKVPETGRIINCMHAVVALERGQRVVIKHYNGLVGFPFEEETAIPIHGCVQILTHAWAVKQGDTWQRVY